jgi:hypothetical protein
VYRFFANRLRNAHPQPEAPAYQETFLERIASEELVFGDKSEHLIGAPGYQQIFSTWKESAERQTRSMTGKELRDRMQLTLGVDWPDNAQTMFAGEQMLITRNRGDRMPVRWLAGTREGQAALVVNPSGSEAASGSSFVRATEAQGVSLLLLDAYQTGVARAPVVRRPGDSLTYHRTDDQNRVQDILTGIAWLHEHALGSIRLHCNGRASAWCLLAAAVTPVPVILDIEPVPAPSTDDELKRLVFIPGLQRAGGLRVAHLLAEPAAPAESAFFR